MEQMSKIPYLTADTKGRKLRRNVPADLRDAVGKTAWVRRVAGKTWSQIKQEAHAFGFETELEISRLRRSARPVASVQKNENEPGFILPLDDSSVVALGLKYFRKKEAEIVEAGGYVLPDDVSVEDIIVDAQLDLADADRAISGQGRQEDEARWSALNFQTFKFLVAEGWATWPSEEPRRIPEALHKNGHFEQLRHYIARADREVARRRVEAINLGKHPSLSDDWFRRALDPDHPSDPTPSAAPRTIEQLTRLFLQKKSDEVGLSRKSQFHVPVRALHETLGEKTLISLLSRSQCQEVADLLIKVPAYTTQHYKGLSLVGAADAYARDNGGHYAQRHSEAQKSLAVIHRIFDLAVYEEWLRDNPFAKVRITIPRSRVKYHQEDDGYEPFELHELVKLFSAPLYVGCLNDENGFSKPGPNIVKRHRYWAPLLSLWTGMRMNEILQLERGDLRRADGIWFISVNDAAELAYDPGTFDKRLKNRNAIRDIPIHPELEKLGFVGWVSARDPGRLFPEADQGVADKPSGPFSKRFNSFLKACGVWVPRRKVFHSFRNNFNDALRAGGVPEEMRVAINGWTPRGASDDARYGKGHQLAVLAEQVRKVDYVGLDLSHLYDRQN